MSGQFTKYLILQSSIWQHLGRGMRDKRSQKYEQAFLPLFSYLHGWSCRIIQRIS